MQDVSQLSPTFQAAAAAAIATAANSYCPYSNFTVGAALVHPDDSITAGCNWENCTFQGTCAERCAIVAANAAGRRIVTAVAVYGNARDATIDAADRTLTTPCGLCRQMLTEVAQLSRHDMDVILVSRGQKFVKIIKLSTLLPSAFGPAD